jgi:hypothetical protein
MLTKQKPIFRKDTIKEQEKLYKTHDNEITNQNPHDNEILCLKKSTQNPLNNEIKSIYPKLQTPSTKKQASRTDLSREKMLTQDHPWSLGHWGLWFQI